MIEFLVQMTTPEPKNKNNWNKNKKVQDDFNPQFLPPLLTLIDQIPSHVCGHGDNLLGGLNARADSGLAGFADIPCYPTDIKC